MIISNDALHAMSPLGLAHLGDAVYELLARREVCKRGALKVEDYHRETVKIITAAAQSKAALKILPLLSAEETAAFKRGRNCTSHAAPKSVTEGEYHNSTGLEALFGWLYLKEQNERIEELFSIILED